MHTGPEDKRPMEIPEFIATLDKLPHTELKLLELANECTLPDGSLDIPAIAARADEFDQASQQAQAYANGTKKLQKALRCLTHNHQA